MCGIAGFCGNTFDNTKQIELMCSKITHRGPNAEGTWSSDNGNITLGHKRLSVVDLSANGTQPMLSLNKRYVISFNGEIYNFKKLAEKLLKDGYISSFRSTSDTEVILEYFCAYGINAVSDMVGMFAIALFDRDTETLYLIRDRLGEKPLYYGIVGDKFAFASELSALKALEGFNNPISRRALNAFFKYKSIPQPLSIYEHIYKLIPGQILTIKAPFKDASFYTYWSVKQAAIKGIKNPFKGTEVEAKKELDRLLKIAIAGQMVSDVPIGSYLSGGIDSPLVTSIMQSLSSNRVKTFTIGFYDKECNEAEFAREISSHLGTSHREYYISEKELLDVVPNLPKLFTEPLADPACLPTYLLSKIAREDVTVTLSGDGGDELFCGYDIYNRINQRWKQIDKVPYGLRNLVGTLIQSSPLKSNNNLYNLGEYCQLKDSHHLHELFRSEHNYSANYLVLGVDHPNDYLLDLCNGVDQNILPDMSQYRDNLYLDHPDSRSAMLYRDQNCFMNDTVLHKVDRAGMAVSLENRIPLLDKDIVEFSWSLPIEYKSSDGINKKILKNLLYDYVPKNLLDRPKHGFEVPLTNWLSGSLSDWAQDLIINCRLVSDGYLNKNIVLNLWYSFNQSKKYTLLLWYILQAEAWYREQL